MRPLACRKPLWFATRTSLRKAMVLPFPSVLLTVNFGDLLRSISFSADHLLCSPYQKPQGVYPLCLPSIETLLAMTRNLADDVSPDPSRAIPHETPSAKKSLSSTLPKIVLQPRTTSSRQTRQFSIPEMVMNKDLYEYTHMIAMLKSNLQLYSTTGKRRYRSNHDPPFDSGAIKMR